ncbi:MAG: MFS transporter [Pirellulales bacterium]|nr:MFS transporter [Pirellulales bacterium]
MTRYEPAPPVDAPGETGNARHEVTRLGDLSAAQWKSGLAAWLGWLFDGLDMHLYVLVAPQFVAELLGAASEKTPEVGFYSSWIQAAFMIGWALGGGFFGRISDRMGRSRALVLTILTYACFTGLSYFAQTWWQLLIFRFLAALGIGGEWAVGASLLSETWPRGWRPWMAAVLQTAVNLGIMLASLANFLLVDHPPRNIFLVGVLPALVVLWIRRHVPEPDEWHEAKQQSAAAEPGFWELFQGPVRRTTILSTLVCALGLSAHWAFMFWYVAYLRNLPEAADWSDAQKGSLVSQMLWLLMISSILGNFAAAAVARWLNYRRTIALFCLAYFLAMAVTFWGPLDPRQLWWHFAVIGASSGVFALFTMYLPPLFPTLLRTTGAGFCYNIGRIAAGLGTVFFGLFSQVGDHRLALFAAGFLFLPAAGFAWLLPEHTYEETHGGLPAP